MSQNESWGTRVGLVLAMAGNAVGLGNFLRFPAQAINNGGGAFIIPYLVSFLLMGLPLLWVEWSMGRYGGKYGSHSTPFMFQKMGGGRPFWLYFGVLGIFINIGVASYYVYIESWTLAYVYHSIVGTFSGMSQTEVANFFNGYVGIADGAAINFTVAAFAFFLVTLFLNIWVLSRGLSAGVEVAARIGMPLLIIFGIILAIRGLTLTAGTQGAKFDAVEGLNFLWTPQYGSLLDPKVWLAAAGQVFFTLSVGMGSIHCYAAYVRANDDIALNGAAAGWTNEFVEVVIGASIVIPISVGYMGLDWVVQNAGLMLGFRTMPYLFQQWGAVLAMIAGVMWFGLLFFAGITSSLAMGTPWMAFMRDEFNWDRRKSAYSFGAIIFFLAVLSILFFQRGVFDEFDYWTGTVALVVFAFGEVIVFAWIFGINNGWEEITRGADMVVPKIYKFVIKYVTPVFIGLVLLGSIFTPKGNKWGESLKGLFTGNGWTFDSSSIISQVLYLHVPDKSLFRADGSLSDMSVSLLARVAMLAVFLGICYLVTIAAKNRKNRGIVD